MGVTTIKQLYHPGKFASATGAQFSMPLVFATKLTAAFMIYEGKFEVENAWVGSFLLGTMSVGDRRFCHDWSATGFAVLSSLG